MINQLENLLRESIDKVSDFPCGILLGAVNTRFVEYATRIFTEALISPDS